ncbi:MAG: hypothetical protein JRJ56_07305 [Deltaproteobacteria bacterium]|nr:hypothetical protein [Deltaproteobacteria bacterium]
MLTDVERFSSYRRLCRRMNVFFTRYLAVYCRHCQEVMARIPDELAGWRLAAGVYPGCCHRGAGDLFRLEGVSGPAVLPPGLVARIQAARRLRLAAAGQDGCSPVYRLVNPATGQSLEGEHCRYFGRFGCRLGDLKGPLCLDFICPPIRADLLAVTGGREELLGPEHDFLWLYRAMAVIGYGSAAAVAAEFAALERRLAALAAAGAAFLGGVEADSLFHHFRRVPVPVAR